MRRHANRFYEGTHWSLKFYESKKEKNGESVSVFLFCALTQITAIIFDHSRKNET